jgi:hypothetical protein
MRATMRPLATIVVAVAALAFAATAGAGSGGLTVDRGIVQFVSSSQIVLRELDGSSVSLAVDGSTVVRLNGLPAGLAEIQPGFVAAVLHSGPRPARAIRAFGRVATSVDSGVIASVEPGRFALRRADGSLITLRTTPSTRVRLNGRPATTAAIRPGRLARVTHTSDGRARLVQLVGRRRA